MTGKIIRTLLVTAAALTLAASAMAAEHLSAGVVDVYPRGARITLEVPASPSIRLELPATLDEKTLTVEGIEGVTIRDWSVRTLPAMDWLPSSLDNLKGQVEQLRAEIGLRQSRLKALRQAASQLEKLEPATTSADETARFVDGIMEKRESLERESFSTNRVIEDAQRRLTVLEQLLESRRPAVKDRFLELTALCEGQGTIRIQAWTSQAGWTPRYRMDLESATGKVSGTLDALVHQKTGLPWEGTVVVHSSQPRSTLNVPELPPMVVDFREDMPYLRESRSMKAMSLAVDEAAAPEDNRVETVTDVALAGRGSVSGDGLQQALPLESFKLEGEMSLVAVPSMSPQAWVLWDLEGTDRAFLAGGVELSIDGAPSGRTRMPALGTGQPLSLAFGTSPLIRTERKDLLAREGSSWTGKGRMERGYAITVTNGLDRAATVTVRDRIPVSVQDKIRVENLEISPEPAEQDDQGLLTWQLELEPGQTGEVTVRYRIAYPGDREITFQD